MLASVTQTFEEKAQEAVKYKHGLRPVRVDGLTMICGLQNYHKPTLQGVCIMAHCKKQKFE